MLKVSTVNYNLVSSGVVQLRSNRFLGSLFFCTQEQMPNETQREASDQDEVSTKESAENVTYIKVWHLSYLLSIIDLNVFIYNCEIAATPDAVIWQNPEIVYS